MFGIFIRPASFLSLRASTLEERFHERPLSSMVRIVVTSSVVSLDKNASITDDGDSDGDMDGAVGGDNGEMCGDDGNMGGADNDC